MPCIGSEYSARGHFGHISTSPLLSALSMIIFSILCAWLYLPSVFRNPSAFIIPVRPCSSSLIMSLNYGYIFSTTEVAKDFTRYDNFKRDKVVFESVPNINISRSMDSNSQPIIPPQVRSQCEKALLNILTNVDCFTQQILTNDKHKSQS